MNVLMLGVDDLRPAGVRTDCPHPCEPPGARLDGIFHLYIGSVVAGRLGPAGSYPTTRAGR